MPAQIRWPLPKHRQSLGVLLAHRDHGEKTIYIEDDGQGLANFRHDDGCLVGLNSKLEKAGWVLRGCCYVEPQRGWYA